MSPRLPIGVATTCRPGAIDVPLLPASERREGGGRTVARAAGAALAFLATHARFLRRRHRTGLRVSQSVQDRLSISRPSLPCGATAKRGIAPSARASETVSRGGCGDDAWRAATCIARRGACARPFCARSGSWLAGAVALPAVATAARPRRPHDRAAPPRPQAEAIGDRQGEGRPHPPARRRGARRRAAAHASNAAELAVAEFAASQRPAPRQGRHAAPPDGGTPGGPAGDRGRRRDDHRPAASRRPVQAVGQVAKAAGKPVIAFSTDASVASSRRLPAELHAGVGRRPHRRVRRVAGQALHRGADPETAYGRWSPAAFQEIGGRRGVRVAVLERYTPTRRTSMPRPSASRRSRPGRRPVPPRQRRRLAAVGQALAGGRARQQPRSRCSAPACGTIRACSRQGDPGRLVRRARQGRLQRLRHTLPGHVRRRADPHRHALPTTPCSWSTRSAPSTARQAFTDATLTNADGVVGTDGLFRFRPTAPTSAASPCCRSATAPPRRSAPRRAPSRRAT